MCKLEICYDYDLLALFSTVLIYQMTETEDNILSNTIAKKYKNKIITHGTLLLYRNTIIVYWGARKVSIGLGNGLVPSGNNQLPEPMYTGAKGFIWWNIHPEVEQPNSTNPRY